MTAVGCPLVLVAPVPLNHHAQGSRSLPCWDSQEKASASQSLEEALLPLSLLQLPVCELDDRA